jgi:hypothetical protein
VDTFLKLFRKGAGTLPPNAPAEREAAPAIVALEGLPRFDVKERLEWREGFPVPDWGSVEDWMRSVPEDRQMEAWRACERAWLLHFRDALGTSFHLATSEVSMVLSSLEPRETRYALAFMGRTFKRIMHVLKGVAEPPPWDHDLLIVFDDQHAYYRYASRYYEQAGEFAASSGMHISRGRSHFITTRSDLSVIEPVVAHEMTHACLAHLPLPLWLDEGLAVNTERRLVGRAPDLFTPEEMHAKLVRFFGEAQIQEFWSGTSFRRSDDGNMLSYELARILVEHLAADWSRFARFANAAHHGDAGAAAAREHLGVELGAMAAALLGHDDAARYAPRVSTLSTQPNG